MDREFKGGGLTVHSRMLKPLNFEGVHHSVKIQIRQGRSTKALMLGVQSAGWAKSMDLDL